MSATDFDDVVKGLLLGEELSVELLEGGDERVGDLDDGRNVHGSGEAVERKKKSAQAYKEGSAPFGEGNSRVVGRLGHVNVVVGVDGLLGSELSAEHLDSTVGDNLQESAS